MIPIRLWVSESQSAKYKNYSLQASQFWQKGHGMTLFQSDGTAYTDMGCPHQDWVWDEDGFSMEREWP